MTDPHTTTMPRQGWDLGPLVAAARTAEVTRKNAEAQIAPSPGEAIIEVGRDLFRYLATESANALRDNYLAGPLKGPLMLFGVPLRTVDDLLGSRFRLVFEGELAPRVVPLPSI